MIRTSFTAIPLSLLWVWPLSVQVLPFLRWAGGLCWLWQGVLQVCDFLEIRIPSENICSSLLIGLSRLGHIPGFTFLWWESKYMWWPLFLQRSLNMWLQTTLLFQSCWHSWMQSQLFSQQLLAKRKQVMLFRWGPVFLCRYHCFCKHFWHPWGQPPPFLQWNCHPSVLKPVSLDSTRILLSIMREVMWEAPNCKSSARALPKEIYIIWGLRETNQQNEVVLKTNRF